MKRQWKQNFITFFLQEQALIRYTTDYLFEHNFELISVPDLLPAEVIEGCGMAPVAENNQVC